MFSSASTTSIIELLKIYEEQHGPGFVVGISAVCAGVRDVEYVFYIEGKDGSKTTIEIPSVYT